MLKVSKILSVLSSPYIQANITSGTIFLNIKILSSLSLSICSVNQTWKLWAKMLIGLPWFTVLSTKVNDSKPPVQNNSKSSCFLFLTLILTQYETPHIFLQSFWFSWRLYGYLQRQSMIYQAKHHISTAHLSI